MIVKANAIQSLRPNSKWQVIDNDTIVWLDTEQTQPTDAEIAAEITRLEADYAAKQYQRDRAAEYPAIGDQLDALFHAGVFPAEMAAQIQAIKDKYPKG
jgi:uncharacterized small protein (DUF1192 family)